MSGSNLTLEEWINIEAESSSNNIELIRSAPEVAHRAMLKMAREIKELRCASAAVSPVVEAVIADPAKSGLQFSHYKAFDEAGRQADAEMTAFSKFLKTSDETTISATETGVFTPDWLWCQLMDYCKEQGIAPANANRLFAIVKRARDLTDNTVPSGSVGVITDAEMSKLVNRFLAWPLPQSVCADVCATNSAYQFPRAGTNLLSGTEAKAMIQYLLSAIGE